jgi:signal transduction histidine kinase
MAGDTDARIALFDKVIRISNATVDIERRLSNLLKLMAREFQADKACLFTLDHDGQALILRSSDSDSEDELGLLRLELDDNFISQTAHLRKPVVLGAEDYRGPNWPTQEFFRQYRALVGLPIMDDQYLYGVLALLHQSPRAYDETQLFLLEAISREIAGTIRNSRLYVEAKKRISELSVLFEVARAVSSSIDLKLILNNVVTISSKVLMAEGCALNILDKTTGKLRVSTEYGLVPSGCSYSRQVMDLDRPVDEATRRCLSRETPYLGSSEEDPDCQCLRKEGKGKSVLCLPLRFKGQFQGVLSLYNKIAVIPGQGQAFNQEDLELVTAMGAMIASSLENALTFETVDKLGQRNEALVRSLHTLYQISGALITSIKTEGILTILINALTHAQGFGFDRALVFLVDEEEKRLMGAAMSDLSGAEVRPGTEPLTETLTRKPMLPPSQQDDLDHFRTFNLPLSQTENVLVKAVLGQEAVMVEKDGFGWDPDRLSGFGRQPFALAPMAAKGKVVGVFAVDQAFSRAPITNEDLRNLSMLANQAGLAIENSRLYAYIEGINQELSLARERLLEAEKLAALGEMAAGMAHEIRNPLVSIGGFTRRIMKLIEPDSPIRPYIQVIIDEVARLEKTLRDVLDFSRDPLEHYTRQDLNAVVQESLYLLRREMSDGNIEVIKEFKEGLPDVFIDKRQIKHVFYNLFLNAFQAMDKGGKLRVKTYLTMLEDLPFVACDVTDTGPGIPPEALPNIFNPFFTTKDAGSGLGLSIVHKILSRHHGEIDVYNRPEGGAIFTVKLPSALEAGIFLK